MRKSKFIFITSFLFLFIGFIGFFFLHSRQTSKHLSVEQMNFLRGDYKKQVKAIDDASEQIRIGNSYYMAGNYQEASEAYKKAYNFDPGSRTFVGFKLIEVYEKLKRYDDALAILDDMLTPNWSEKGLKKASEIRARLLRLKAGGQVAAKKKLDE